MQAQNAELVEKVEQLKTNSCEFEKYYSMYSKELNKNIFVSEENLALVAKNKILENNIKKMDDIVLELNDKIA